MTSPLDAVHDPNLLTSSTSKGSCFHRPHSCDIPKISQPNSSVYLFHLHCLPCMNYQMQRLQLQTGRQRRKRLRNARK